MIPRSLPFRYRAYNLTSFRSFVSLAQVRRPIVRPDSHIDSSFSSVTSVHSLCLSESRAMAAFLSLMLRVPCRTRLSHTDLWTLIGQFSHPAGISSQRVTTLWNPHILFENLLWTSCKANLHEVDNYRDSDRPSLQRTASSLRNPLGGSEKQVVA